jgi:branched-chain amino acid transport system substrate-binding protein
MRNNHSLWAAALLLTLATMSPAAAQKQYGPGVSDTEIKIGQTMPFSGPASAYSTIAKAEIAYFAMLNERGGINGRKITLISLDDGYSPAKTLEQTRRLVEQEDVLLDFNPLGTASNSAIQKYLNEKKVPQLFVASGATKWGDPERFPWTMGWAPTYQTEGHIFARYILAYVTDAKIAVLYQNDDYGKDYLKGLKDGLGQAANRIIMEATYEAFDPTVDSQIVSLQASGANVFYDVSGPKFAAQAIRKIYDIGWRPLHLLNSVSSSVGVVLKPAGFDRSEGIITATYLKDPTDPQVLDDPAYKDWLAWMQHYYPDGDLTDVANVYGYNVAMTMVQVLKQCGDDLTRENAMRQAAHLDLELPMLLPGIAVSTSPSQFYPIREMQLQRFNGHIYERFGDVISSQ